MRDRKPPFAGLHFEEALNLIEMGKRLRDHATEAERLAVEVTAWEDTVTRRRASLAEAEVKLRDLKDRLAALPRQRRESDA